MNGLRSLLAIVLLGAGVGCRSGEPANVVGKWKYPVADGADAGIEFRADRTYREWFRGGKIDTESSGSYEVEGRTLQIAQTYYRGTSGKEDTTPRSWTTEFTIIDGGNRLELKTPEGSGIYERSLP